ncbi:unnamed protein product [Chrysoparadoxa australica]
MRKELAIGKAKEKERRSISRKPRSSVAEHERRSSGRLQGMPVVEYSEDALARAGQPHKKLKTRGAGGHARGLSRFTRECYTVPNINALSTCDSNYMDHSDRLPLMEEMPSTSRKSAKVVGRFWKDTGEPQAKATGVCCHWCRQKDTSIKTTCSKEGCKKGHICGPCLQGRYGENIFELVKADHTLTERSASWLCPHCRGICNCSCTGCTRKSKGWGATGQLALVAESFGYESAGHYLILGVGFDQVILRLLESIEKKDRESLKELLETTAEMDLDAEVTAKSFPRTLRSNGDAMALKGETWASDEKLFGNGCTAQEVVNRLRDLVAQAEKLMENCA